MNRLGKHLRMIIVTDRLELIAGTLELTEAELHDPGRFADLLAARVPANWPPPLNDNATMDWCRRYYKKHSDGVGWANWYFVLREDSSRQRVAIGNGGFGGKPTAGGTIKLGYSIMQEFQERGYATEAVRGLVLWAFSHSEVARIIGETYPNLTKSIRVLEKNGFVFIGGGAESGVIGYELRCRSD